MSKFILPFLFLLIITLPACKKDKELYRGYTFNFETDAQGWNAYYSDYPVGQENFYELFFGHSRLPAPLDITVKALKITGNNHSDDLLSLIYRKFEALEPNRVYAVSFSIDLASNVQTNIIGIGGAPDLALGAGGISFEPASSIDDQGLYRPNFSSALQSRQSNDTLKMLGTIGVGENITEYTLINRNNLQDPIYLSSNNKGELWLVIGTDSGFEGPTTLYYKTISVSLK
jgi:hypothetical protein